VRTSYQAGRRVVQSAETSSARGDTERGACSNGHSARHWPSTLPCTARASTEIGHRLVHEGGLTTRRRSVDRGSDTQRKTAGSRLDSRRGSYGGLTVHSPSKPRSPPSLPPPPCQPRTTTCAVWSAWNMSASAPARSRHSAHSRHRGNTRSGSSTVPPRGRLRRAAVRGWRGSKPPPPRRRRPPRREAAR